MTCHCSRVLMVTTSQQHYRADVKEGSIKVLYILTEKRGTQGTFVVDCNDRGAWPDSQCFRF